MNSENSINNYDSFNKTYNKNQFDKIKNNTMPKENIKSLKINNDNDKYINLISKSKNKSENDFLIGNGLNDDYDYINQEGKFIY